MASSQRWLTFISLIACGTACGQDETRSSGPGAASQSEEPGNPTLTPGDDEAPPDTDSAPPPPGPAPSAGPTPQPPATSGAGGPVGTEPTGADAPTPPSSSDGPGAESSDDDGTPGERLDGGAPDEPAPVDDAPDAAAAEPNQPVEVPCDPSSAPRVGALGLQVVIHSDELRGVSYARQPPGSDDWYLVEQRGRIMVSSQGSLRPTPFLDVSDEINLNPTYDERGLHAIEFAPDYESSGLFYIVMTASQGPRQNHDLVLEYRRSDADPYLAETTPTKTLLDLEGRDSTDLFANIHNAYLAKFGPDGFLYVGMGDGGGSCNDNEGFVNLPQDVSSPIGKMLRFDPSAPPPHAAPGNPFTETGGDPRVFHYGLRNPFRFGWDPITGEMYIGDVGQDTHEEISVAPPGSAGLNFGWATWEGNEMICNNRPQNPGSDVVAPIFYTNHGQGNGQFGAGCSASAFCDYSAIVGGAVYRGTRLTQLQGAYVFGDWVADNMAAIYHCNGETSDVTSIDYVPDPNLPNNGYFVNVGSDVPELGSISAIVEDHAYELHLVANGNSLLQIVPAP